MNKFTILIGLISISLLSFTYKKRKKFKVPENYVYVPSGTTTIGDKDVSCNAFFMAQHEVTNKEYRDFVQHLRENGKEEDLQKAIPDTTVWNQFGSFSEPMVNLYFSHPAYDNYPVVGVTREGAELYCIYLTEMSKELYGDVINDFRLPFKEEWIYAAQAGNQQNAYAWNGPYLRDDEGNYLANFKHIGEENITTDENGNPVIIEGAAASFIEDGSFYTSPTMTYYANDYGLYNMSGNVAEMVAKENVSMGGHWYSTGHDIRVDSEEEFTAANPFVGFRPVMTFLSTK